MRYQNYVCVGSIKSRTSAIKDLAANFDAMASSGLNVLIVGGRSTGRDSAVNELHKRSPQAQIKMHTIICQNAMPDDVKLKDGCLNYVDRVNLLSKRQQSALKAQMLKNTEIRVVASADKDIGPMMDENKFYVKLYNMLAQIRIRLPDLRERREDIPMLVRTALSEYNKDYGKQVKIEKSAVDILTQYNYIGNVKELFNIIERAVLVNRSGVIKTNNIMSILDMESVALVALMKNSGLSYKSETERFEKQLIAAAVANTGSTRKAAAQLGVSQSFVFKKCKYFGIPLREAEPADYDSE